MKNGFNIGNGVKREIIRAILQRTQTMDTAKMMSAIGASEPAVYDDVEEKLNITYVNRAEVPLALDVFKPNIPKGTELPVIIVIHGGGLFMGDRFLNRPYCRLLAHKGYLVFSLEYRLAPEVNVGQQLDDVCAGMDYIGQMMVKYDVDFGRIFLVADSAGAYLGSFVSAMHESEKLQSVIGYKPSRMVYSAVGFICGMFYTSKVLQEQIFGNRREDEKYLKYMNVENPEILKNLPPVFMISSCGDSLNNDTLKYHKALKKAGRPVKLMFCGNEELIHIFPIINPEHPKSLEATDKMLAYFEEQAALRAKLHKKDSSVVKSLKKLEQRIADDRITDQKVWENLKERITADPATLGKTALIDCTREYTYEEMLDNWDRYAKVFSALGITSEHGSRAALCGAITAEPIFALYALNMTGAEVSLFSYPDFLPNGMWKDMIEKEKITDLIISDIMVTPQIYEEIKEIKEKFGLRNVIFMHSLMGGPTIGPAEMIFNEYNYHSLKNRPDTVFMNDLLKKYEDKEILYDTSKGERIAFITHTSGTTKGTRKLLPFTDKMFNNTLKLIPHGLRTFLPEGEDTEKQIRVIQMFDMSSIYGLSGQLHTVFSTRDTLVTTFFGFMHPKFIRAIDYYNITILQGTGFMIDKWMDRTDIDDVDMSSLKVVGLSGGYIPPEKMEKYKEFLREHGYKYEVTAGYGMSEAGGKPIFAPKESADKDILGYAENPDEMRVKDETDGKFYKLSDGPRTGLLYRLSEIRPQNELDGQTLYEYTKIEGKDYLCTNDLIRVNEDGSFSFAGRADKYFVNNEGKKFNSGLVDNQMSLHPAIDRCAVVPVMEKRIHDTVPVLYVVPSKKGPGAAEAIHQALIDVYVNDRKIDAENLPTQFMIVNDIPVNANGKLDIYRITRERIDGDAYNLTPVMEEGKLVNITVKHVEHLNSMTGGALPESMQNNSAYNVFDLFTTNTKKTEPDFSWLFNPFWPLELLLGDNDKKKWKPELPKVPEDVKKKVLKYGNRVSGLTTGRKHINFDFED